MRVAVIGHVEWVDFVRVDAVPAAGDIVHATRWWEEPGGGGAVAAVQLVKLTGSCLFLTALGDDTLGHRAHDAIAALGVRVEAAFHTEPQRRAITLVDGRGERTITVLGARLVPRASDPLPWGELCDCDAVYVTGCDADALRQARRARVVVTTSRAMPLLREAGVALDAVVGSETDPSERYEPIEPPPRLVVRTDGARGGSLTVNGRTKRFAAAPIPGPVGDAYGAGDAFAAGLTFALARGDDPAGAVAFAARCGAAALTGDGPYEGQLRA